MNFHKYKVLFIFLLFLFIQLTANAYTAKEGNILAKLGYFASKTAFQDSYSLIDTPIQSGFGLFAEGDMWESGGLEIGIMYMRKLFIRQQADKYISERTELMHIGMGYRHWFNTWLSGSLLFYSEYTMGDPEVVHSDFAPGADIDTSARDTTEYGFDVSLQSIIWEKERYAVVLDGRYSISFTNKDHEHGHHYGAFVAFQYFIQEKKAKPIPKKRPANRVTR